MSTSTQSASHKSAPGVSVATSAGAQTIQGWLLILLVFVAGACSLAVEVSASRLLAPYFGDTLFVWANLIGLILLYLTIGYYVGGRLADRYPRASVLYILTGCAALLIALIPFISQPILLWAQSAFASNSLGVFYGSLISVILLFVVPTVLLGCVSPFAIRLRIEQVGSAGSISGKLYAISTVGSIVGTFLPVLLLLPNIGTAKTFFAFGIALLLVSLGGWLTSRVQERRSATSTQAASEDQENKPRTRVRLADYSLQSWLLILLVFVEGACALAVEISASRLLAPYFGTSLFIWANLIGLILLYLTIGYYVGGRFADRHPSATVLYTLTIIAAFVIALIPLIARPILAWSQSSFTTYSIGVFYGSLSAVILLFAVPVILLSCVSPFAIRLQVEQVGKSGSIAGKLYAISTAGSIVGTFLPALVLIPTLGTYRTFFIFAVALLLVSLLGLLLSSNSSLSLGTRPRLSVRLLAILLLIPMIWSTLAIRGPIKPADGNGLGGGTLLTERESAYNYIQVVQVGTETQLILNEGVGIHSIYDPNNILTGGPWDYFLDAPYFNKPPFTPQQVRNVCVIGLGAGTIPHDLTAAYGPIPIDGVELDGEIVNLARQYFHMDEPNLHVIVQDGRYFLQTTQKKYDEIGIDAYQQPYVPFQLTTKEFFQTVRSHLTPTGVTVINAGRTSNDFRLVEALAQTMRAVFPSVYIIDTARFSNSIIVATNAPTTLSNFQTNAANLTNPLLQAVARSSIQIGNLREETSNKVYFTDDQAPVEQLIDSIILGAVRNAGQ